VSHTFFKWKTVARPHLLSANNACDIWGLRACRDDGRKAVMVIGECDDVDTRVDVMNDSYTTSSFLP
jgi:hypothetical protein